jgi:acyl carrier protein
LLDLKQKITEEIKEILLQIIPDSDFLSSREFIIDGLDSIRLIADLDKKFNISIKGLEMIPENFVSFNSLTNLVNTYQK